MPLKHSNGGKRVQRFSGGWRRPGFARLDVSAAFAGEKVKVTDITGRQVEVSVPVERVILGEGRQIYFTAALDTETPFKRIVGWRDDFQKADLDGYNIYLKKFPEMAKIPTFGGMKDGTFDIEQAVTLKPDVIIMNIDAKSATEESGYIEKLSKVGIPLVYVDFREKSMENTDPSMRLIGKLFGKEAKAEEFVKFHDAQLARVTDTLAFAKDLKKPSSSWSVRVAIAMIAACPSAARISARWSSLPAASTWRRPSFPVHSSVNPEQIIASNPDQIIVTGSNWELYVPGASGSALARVPTRRWLPRSLPH